LLWLIIAVLIYEINFWMELMDDGSGVSDTPSLRIREVETMEVQNEMEDWRKETGSGDKKDPWSDIEPKPSFVKLGQVTPRVPQNGRLAWRNEKGEVMIEKLVLGKRFICEPLADDPDVEFEVLGVGEVSELGRYSYFLQLEHGVSGDIYKLPLVRKDSSIRLFDEGSHIVE
jgi:hypothetical protein